MDNFSIRFATLRKTLKVSQQEMAQKMKVTQKTLSSWEQGHNEPCSSLSELVTSYNINLNWLLTGEGKMFIDYDTNNTQNIQNQSGNSVFTNNGKMINNSSLSSNIDKVTQVLFEEAYKKASQDEDSLKKLKLFLMDF
jgi:transcriptional regulator with XRE-family HTH domain